MKIRIIPTVLTDGTTVVKGTNFNNWRTIGSALATAKLFGQREVDELLFLDVNARSRGSIISKELLSDFSQNLNIPFTVGGGISSLKDAEICIRSGAEKIVLGSSAITNPRLITQIANVYGAQAVMVALDFDSIRSKEIKINSGQDYFNVNSYGFVSELESLGAGEILLQSIERDGTMEGPDLERIRQISELTSLPIIASGGISNSEDAISCIKSGASALGIGALFQFTKTTPRDIRSKLHEAGFKVRKV